VGAVCLARARWPLKIRVIQVLASLQRAGAERMAVSLACGLDPARFETELVSLYDAFPDGFEEVLDRHRVRVHHLGKRRGLDLWMIPRLIRVFRGFRPAIVHTHSYVLRYTFPAVRLRPGATPRGTAPTMVHTVHNVATREVDALGRLIHRIAFRHGVVAVAVGAEVARSFQKSYGFDTQATIPNGIDVELFSRPGVRQEWRRAHGFTIEDGLIVSVARLEPQKNPLALIEAFVLALGDRPRWHLLLCGDGSLREQARAYGERSGKGDRVHFLGVRTDLPEVLSACDIFALASKWEGNPIAVMEAMAAGLGIVATTAGGIPDLIEHANTGLLARPGDVRQFADALATLANHPDRRIQLGENARLRAAGFHVTAMIKSYEDLFERLQGVRS
jgi:glycosyltransferase involved in cell wall biosynthesis